MSMLHRSKRGNPWALVTGGKFVQALVHVTCYLGKLTYLSTSSSAINKQIALKNVGKLHFSAGAVWNGQEALDYLLEEPSTEHSRPDIILMDV